MRRGRSVGVAAAVLCTAVLVGCRRMPGRPTAAERPRPPSAVHSFDALYAEHCAGCHGAHGAHGPARPLHDPLYLAWIPKGALERVIARGVPDSLMPAFARAEGGPLTDAQVDVLVAGMRKRWGAPAQSPPLALPPYSEKAAEAAGSAPGDLQRGRQVYATYCARCHGPSGRGGEHGGSVVAPDYLALVSDQALRSTVVAGRVDLEMPNFRHDAAGRRMSDQDVSDVVAWLVSHRTGAARMAATGGGDASAPGRNSREKEKADER